MNYEIRPYEIVLEYFNIVPMQEFDIERMADTPYHFNCVGSLCNCRNEIRNEMLSVILLEPNRVIPVRKYYEGSK
jgi:hypothetical protein